MREPSGDVGREAFTGSEWAVRLSPEMDKLCESRGFQFSRRQHRSDGVTVVAEVSPGSANVASAQAIPGNQGRFVASTRRAAVGGPQTKPQAQAGRSGPARERTTRSAVVSPSEGNEARRNGRRAIGAPHSTDEVGEPTQGTPWMEGGAR